MEPLANDVIETNIEKKFKDEDNRTNINSYIVHKKIGSGPFSKIKLAFHKERGKFYALKQYNKSVMKKKKELTRSKEGKTIYRDNFQDVLNEIRVMKSLNHLNIIKLYEVIDDPESEKIFLVTEYCEKGQIIDWDDTKMEFKSCRAEKTLTEKEIARVIKQVVNGIEYLHSNGIVHRDLKPQNILECEDGTVKLIDFDIAAINEKNMNINKTRGTLHFMAPEMCKKSLAVSDEWSVCRTSDIWAFGVTLYSFVYLKLPFFEQSLAGLIHSIENNTPLYPESIPISSELKNLMQRLLEKNPKKRIKLEEIKSHEWFKLALEN